MAVIALQRTHRGGSTWAGHVFWAGDSRAYVFDPERRAPAQHRRPPGPRRRHGQPAPRLGGQQRHVGRHRVPRQLPPGRAARRRSCWSARPTAASATCRRRCTSSTCVLQALPGARSTEAWSGAVQAEIAAVTGDDAAMAVMGVGADLDELPGAARAPPGRAGASSSSRPLDELRRAVAGGRTRAGSCSAAPPGRDRRRCGTATSRATSGTSAPAAERPPDRRGRSTRQPPARPTDAADHGDDEPTRWTSSRGGDARRRGRARTVPDGGDVDEGRRRDQRLHHPGGLQGGRRRTEQVDLRRARRPAVLHQGVPQPDLSRRRGPGQREDQGQEAGPLRGLREPPPRHADRAGAAVGVRRQPDRHPGLLPLGRQVLQGHREGRRRGARRRAASPASTCGCSWC